MPVVSALLMLFSSLPYFTTFDMASLFVRTISSPHACSFVVCLSIASLRIAVFYLLLVLLNRYFYLKLTELLNS